MNSGINFTLKKKHVAIVSCGNLPHKILSMKHIFKEHRPEIFDEILKCGSIIFQNFPEQSIDELSDTIREISREEIFYKGGLGPRTKLGKSVYTASDVSKLFPIKVHQEMSYQDTFPDNVIFYCAKAARVRGETPIVDMRRVTRDIEPYIYDKFDDLGVKYIATFYDQDRILREFTKSIIPFYIHLTWQDAFGSIDRDVVEQECKNRKLTCKWRANGDLETHTTLPAFRVHPVTGDKVWFNSVQNLHFSKVTLKSDLGNLLYYFRKLLYKRHTDLPNQVYFGDGTKIQESELTSVYSAIEAHTYHHEWKIGELMLLDNYLVAHGRNSYRGERKIYASLMNSFSKK